jgi:hypothetical protein
LTIGDLSLPTLNHQMQGEDCHHESTHAITLAVVVAARGNAIKKRKACAMRLRTGTCQTS